MTQKLGQISKIRPDKLLVLCPNLRMRGHMPAPIINGGGENGRISDFQGLVTLTLILDRVILHTIMHHSSTSTYIPNFIEIEQTLWTDGHTDVWTDI